MAALLLAARQARVRLASPSLALTTRCATIVAAPRHAAPCAWHTRLPQQPSTVCARALTTTRLRAAGAVSAAQPPAAVQPITHNEQPGEQATADLRALLGAYFPLDELQFIATYGSAAFAQLSEEEAAARAAQGNCSSTPSSTADEPMLDLIFSVADPIAFHRSNMSRNPSHYSAIRWAAPWSGLISAVQEYGAGVWYNTLIRLDVPGRPGQTQLVKYGVVSTDRLVRDLRDWDALYLAGRMHKPMHVLACSDQIRQAAECNLQSALRTSMLLLESTPSATAAASPSAPGASLVRVTGQSFFTALASISYAGDIRMGFAENPHKVAKIVVGNWRELVKLYSSALAQVIGPATRITQLKEMVEFECDSMRRLDLLQHLPRQVQAEMIDELRSDPAAATLPSISLLPLPARHSLLTRGLAKIVSRSSKQQTMKGLLTAGISKSLRYGWAKVQKATRK